MSTPAGGPDDQRRTFFGRRDFDLTRDLLCVFDFEGIFLDANRALLDKLGYKRDELLGRHVADCVHPEDRDRTFQETRRLAAGGYRTFGFENRYWTKHGEWIWLEWTGQAALVERLVYASARDITSRKEREVELEQAAHLDPLTGLANRRAFELALDRELATARRHSLRPALVVVDLDRFKEANDRHGHQVGDELLVTTARALESTTRASDMPARIGGDEFAVLLPNCDLETAEHVAGKIVSALRTRAVETGEGTIPIHASAGVALLGQPEVSTGTELLTAADRAMYRAKRRRSSLGIHDGPVVEPPSA